MGIRQRIRPGHVAAMLALAALGAAGTAATAGAIVINGKFTGGGFIGNPDTRVSLGLDLSCTAGDPGSELQINWFNPQPDPPGREAFHLEVMEQAACETGDPADRNDGGTHEGAGTGVCKTQTGSSAPARVGWRLTDSGLGGPDTRPDSLEVHISSALPACNLQVAGPLDGGNFRMIGDVEN